MEVMALFPSDPLPPAFRAMGAAGTLLYFGGVGIGVYRSFAVIARERIVAVTLIGVLMLTGSGIDGLVLLILVDAILLVTLIFEYLRIEGSSSRASSSSSSTGSVDDARIGDDVAQ